MFHACHSIEVVANAKLSEAMRSFVNQTIMQQKRPGVLAHQGQRTYVKPFSATCGKIVVVARKFCPNFLSHLS